MSDSLSGKIRNKNSSVSFSSIFSDVNNNSPKKVSIEFIKKFEEKLISLISQSNRLYNNIEEELEKLYTEIIYELSYIDDIKEINPKYFGNIIFSIITEMTEIQNSINIICNKRKMVHLKASIMGNNKYTSLFNQLEYILEDIKNIKNDIKNINELIKSITVDENYKIKDIKRISDYNGYNYYGQINDSKTKYNDYERLDLNEKLYDNKIFDKLYQSESNLTIIKRLNLNHNLITSTEGLKKFNFENLEVLVLSNNKINKISFSSDNFPNLKKLWLYNNEIEDISPLAYINIKNLEILSLSDNDIIDISCLKNFYFSKLKVLNLGNNMIKDISVLDKVVFQNLEKLGLNNNIIEQINVFSKSKLLQLKEIYLGDNHIEDISVFGKVDFPNLEILSLYGNRIADISCFTKAEFKKLKKLYLYDNNITDKNALFEKRGKIEELIISI